MKDISKYRKHCFFYGPDLPQKEIGNNFRDIIPRIKHISTGVEH